MVQPAGVGAPTLADAFLAGEHEHLRALIEDISDVVIVLDQAAVIRYASASIERITGARPDEVVGRPVFDLLNPEHRQTQQELFESVLRDGSPRAAVPLVLVDRGGVRHRLEVILANRVDHPAIGGVVVTARDISERAEADALLAQESVLLEAIARGMPMVSVLQQVSRLIERHVDRAWCSVGVLEQDGVVRHHSAVSLPPEIVVFLDNTDPLSELGQSLRMLDSDVVIYDDIATDPRWEGARSLASDHDLAACWTLTVNASDTGDLLGVLTVFHPDRRGPLPAELALLERCRALAAIAIERRRVEARLQHQALHDSLTGLPNRTLIFDRIEQALARSRRRGTDMAVLFVDLDQFKVINDSLGHAAGDRLLEQVAARFSAMVRSDDTVGRFGGDEFVVVCEDVEGEDGAMDVGNRLRRSLAPPFPLGAAEVVATASVGIVMATDTSTPEALIRDSDAAMYRAKAQGRNRCAVADQAMHLRLMHRLELEHALRGAIDGEQLILHYQPRVRLADGVVTGMEALLRWRHADGRLLGADETVPLAEETGLIVPIGAWALGEACRQAVRWDSVIGGPPLGIHVNVSARQLADPNLVDLVTQTLATTGLDAERLCLEVTESVLASDADGTSATLAQLKELGLRLAIDDFGTGYATLDYLRRFSMADELKIDRSFVAGLTHFHSTDAAIVSAAVVLADALGFEAVAEGVETAGQLAVLRRLGCTQAQGYLFCPPLPAAEVEAHLRR